MDEKMNDNELPDDIEASNDEVIEPELEDIEVHTNSKIKLLKIKLKECEKEKMLHLEDLQRAKAEFLNSKKRLESERARDKERAVNTQIEKLLPLCDSFHMAMKNEETWQAIDKEWRTGIESIHSQLHSILDSYGVSEINPTGADFDPSIHEAMTNVSVDTEKQHNKIISVILNGFTRTIDGKTELIRPARVVVGEYKN